MKAAYMTEFGGPDVFTYGEMKIPKVENEGVLVRVEACGLNYYDTLVRQGAVSKDIPLPHIPGADVVGIVEKTGKAVKNFAPGDAVIVAPGFPLQQQEWHLQNFAPSFYPGGTFNHGGYAQYMQIHERCLLKNDTQLPMADLATIPLVLQTAMHTVKTLGRVTAENTVLVHAGASGSGSMAIQVAKAMGASVITTVSTEAKARLARSLGADEIIYYKKDNFAEIANEWTNQDGVDVIIDNLGGTALADNIRALKWGGKIINYGLVAGLESTIPNVYEFFRGQYQLCGSFMGTLDELKQGLELLKQGKIKAVLDDTLPLAKIRKAHEMIDSHQVIGNLVLLPWV